MVRQGAAEFGYYGKRAGTPTACSGSRFAAGASVYILRVRHVGKEGNFPQDPTSGLSRQSRAGEDARLGILFPSVHSGSQLPSLEHSPGEPVQVSIDHGLLIVMLAGVGRGLFAQPLSECGIAKEQSHSISHRCNRGGRDQKPVDLMSERFGYAAHRRGHHRKRRPWPRRSRDQTPRLAPRAGKRRRPGSIAPAFQPRTDTASAGSVDGPHVRRGLPRQCSTGEGSAGRVHWRAGPWPPASWQNP